MKKKICVVTSSRSEYGLLLPLLKCLKAKKEVHLDIVVTGAHLLKAFGMTYRAIIDDGFSITSKIRIPLGDDSIAGMARAMSETLLKFTQLFQRSRPDILILLGDRYEIFSVATAAHINRIPIAHIHGGEVTEGAIDDAFRHAITKMSMFHFTSAKAYTRRVVQLGENPGRVFTVGALGLDNMKKINLLSKARLEKELRFKFGERNILVTFHPATLEESSAKEQCSALLEALDSFRDIKVIFTKPGADPESGGIIELIEKYVKINKGRAALFSSLGQQKYLSLLRFVDAVAGNSSSGIIEVPSFHIPTVNVGDRQAGRIHPDTVIECKPTKRSIEEALRLAFSRKFIKICKKAKNPYGDGTAAERIARILRNIKIPKNVKKRFFDLYV